MKLGDVCEKTGVYVSRCTHCGAEPLNAAVTAPRTSPLTEEEARRRVAEVENCDEPDCDTCGRLAPLLLRVDSEARAELVRTRATLRSALCWVADLQSGMWINCVYCGHRYGPKESGATIPAAGQTMADALAAHVAVCPKHPMSALRADLDEAVRLLDEMRGKSHVYRPNCEWPPESGARCTSCRVVEFTQRLKDRHPTPSTPTTTEET